MPRVRRLSITLLFATVVVGASSSPAHGGDGPPSDRSETVEDVLARLRRPDDLRSVAWGAWLAAQNGVREAGPLLVERLRETSRQADAPGVWETEATLLDAVIRLRVSPPPDVLLDVTRHPAAIVVLCSRLRVPTRVLLTLYDRWDAQAWDDVPWLAFGNLLDARRVPGWTVRLLRHYRIHRLVRVFDRPGPYAPLRTPSDSVPGDGLRSVPAGFPPVPRYDLEQRFREGAALIAPGLRQVWATRWLDHERCWTHWNVGDFLSPSRDACREEWLRSLAGLRVTLRRLRLQGVRPWHRATSTREREALPLCPACDEVVCLRWTGCLPWRRETAAYQREVQISWWHLVSRLIRRGSLTPDEARTLVPVITFTLRDERGFQRPPLPPIVPLPFRSPLERAKRRGMGGV